MEQININTNNDSAKLIKPTKQSKQIKQSKQYCMWRNICPDKYITQDTVYLCCKFCKYYQLCKFSCKDLELSKTCKYLTDQDKSSKNSNDINNINTNNNTNNNTNTNANNNIKTEKTKIKRSKSKAEREIQKAISAAEIASQVKTRNKK